MIPEGISGDFRMLREQTLCEKPRGRFILHSAPRLCRQAVRISFGASVTDETRVPCRMSSSIGCRQAVLNAARRLHQAGHRDFSPAEIILQVQRDGHRFADSTVRTFVVSVMCANAPVNHGTTYDDLERVGRARYRLRKSV